MSLHAAALAIAAVGSPTAPRPPGSPPPTGETRPKSGADLPVAGIPHTFPSDDPHASHHPDAWDASSHLQLLCLLIGQFAPDPAPTKPVKP